MERKGWMILRVLLNRYYGGLSEEVAAMVPESYRATLKQSDLSATDAASLLVQPSFRLKNIHYSWFIPAIQALPKPLRKPTIGALEHSQAIGICRMLRCGMPETSPSSPIGEFLLHTLYHRVDPEERLPASYLEDTPLKSLAVYSKATLTKLIDLLGIRDLVQEVRLIVNKHHQEALMNCLTEEERQFFEFYMYKQREKLKVPRLNLTGWNGEPRKVRQQIQIRGLMRFGKALSGQNPDFLWYIYHTLDTGRAAIIKQYCANTPIEGLTAELQRQVIGLINYFNKKE